MTPNPKLKLFLKPYSQEIQTLTYQLRDYLTELVPQANELIWDNYNALAMAYCKSEKLSDAFCHISVYAKHVNFGFNRGAELTKTNLKLEGKGKLIRHLKVKDYPSFPKEAITTMVWEAVQISEQLNPELRNKEDLGGSIVMSISEKKIRPTNKV